MTVNDVPYPFMLRQHVPDDSWRSVAAVTSGVAYVLLPFMIVNPTWTKGDKALAFYVSMLTIGTIGYHALLAKDPKTKPGDFYQHLDNVGTSLITVSLFTAVLTGTDDSRVIWVPLVALAGEFLLVYAMRKCWSSDLQKAKDYKNYLDFIAAVTILVCAFVFQEVNDTTLLAFGGASIAVAGLCWLSGDSTVLAEEGHALWHVFTALGVALLWRSI